MYVSRNHQRYGQTDGRTDGRTSSDPMTATLLKHVAVKRQKDKKKEKEETYRPINNIKIHSNVYSFR